MNREEAQVVVCIDDEPAILSSLQRLLRNEPYLLLTTGKPEEAMTWVLERKARILIADQRMPSMTGLQLLEMVRACSPETVRVMLTGQSDLTEIMRRKAIEAVEHLVRKPWEPDELKGIVRKLLQKPPARS
jgi:response regulator RpfG family c-di-GMP phosphodiesterase